MNSKYADRKCQHPQDRHPQEAQHQAGQSQEERDLLNGGDPGRAADDEHCHTAGQNQAATAPTRADCGVEQVPSGRDQPAADERYEVAIRVSIDGGPLRLHDAQDVPSSTSTPRRPRGRWRTTRSDSRANGRSQSVGKPSPARRAVGHKEIGMPCLHRHKCKETAASACPWHRHRSIVRKQLAAPLQEVVNRVAIGHPDAGLKSHTHFLAWPLLAG